MGEQLTGSKLAIAGTAVNAPSGIQRSAGATNVHRARKPLRDDRAQGQDGDHHGKVKY
ncbi:MAG: hypothetical protein M3447_11350 [Acidobacteriota bacterium]|nr:hypothetical protein [Acidobacteriota bacterium]